jgi:hypothetical protein
MPSQVELQLSRLCRRYIALVRLTPAELSPKIGSKAAQELTPSNTNSTEIALAKWSGAAYGVADLQLRAACDHLVGLADLLSKSTTALGVVSVSRSCAEASSRAAWLANPTITRQTRAGRGLSETLYSWGQEHELPLAAIPPDSQSIIDGALADAGILTFSLSTPRSGPQRGQSQDRAAPVPQLLAPYKRPGATAAISELLDPISEGFGRTAYALWSAAGHATAYGLLSHLVDDPDGEGVRFERDTEATISTVAAACVGLVFAYTVRLVCAGSDTSRLESTCLRLDATWRTLFASQRTPNGVDGH